MSQQSGSQRLPHWLLASLPIVTVLATILLPRLMLAISPSVDQAPAWVVFASAQPIVWPSLALLIGSLVALMLFKAVRGKALDVMGRGTRDALMPLINTAAVIGFGGVVTQTAAFSGFVDVFTNASWPPLLSMFGSISLLSAITGSASGGLQIFMQTLAPHYLEAGIAPETLHRLVTIASGGFDSLPHCGAVVALLTIAGVTHREAYKDIGVITVVLPVAAGLASIAVASF